MKILDHDKVLAHFLRMTGMEAEDFSHAALFDNAESFLLSHLNVSGESLDAGQTALCEYAAAAVAVYDHAFELCLRERRVMSETGEVVLKREDRSALETAAELRQNAMRLLASAGIADIGDFAFMGV